jgi:hypothetical protein
MDLTVPTLVAGVLGGLVIAAVLVMAQRQRHAITAPSPFDGVAARDVINISSIRVAGLGGLGMIAVSVGLALTFPTIGWSLLLSAVLGTLLAVLLIWRGRRLGPMGSSSQRRAANTTFDLQNGSSGPRPRR